MECQALEFRPTYLEALCRDDPFLTTGSFELGASILPNALQPPIRGNCDHRLILWDQDRIHQRHTQDGPKNQTPLSRSSGLASIALVRGSKLRRHARHSRAPPTQCVTQPGEVQAENLCRSPPLEISLAP